MVKSMAWRWLVLSPVEGEQVARSAPHSTRAVGQERVLGHRLPADIAFSSKEHAATGGEDQFQAAQIGATSVA